MSSINYPGSEEDGFYLDGWSSSRNSTFDTIRMHYREPKLILGNTGRPNVREKLRELVEKAGGK